MQMVIAFVYVISHRPPAYVVACNLPGILLGLSYVVNLRPVEVCQPVAVYLTYQDFVSDFSVSHKVACHPADVREIFFIACVHPVVRLSLEEKHCPDLHCAVRGSLHLHVHLIVVDCALHPRVQPLIAICCGYESDRHALVLDQVVCNNRPGRSCIAIVAVCRVASKLPGKILPVRRCQRNIRVYEHVPVVSLALRIGLAANHKKVSDADICNSVIRISPVCKPDIKRAASDRRIQPACE